MMGQSAQSIADKGEALLPRIRLDIENSNDMRAALRDYFIATFDAYESLFETLSNDKAWFEKAIGLRHPLVFYYGHTATFFVNKLLLTQMIDTRIDEHMESIFAVGVDEMSWDDLDDVHYDWPSIREVQTYRDKVRAMVLDLIDHAPLQTPIDWNHPWWAIIMGAEHERIHLETSSVLIRQHRLDNVQRHAQWDVEVIDHAAPENTLVAVAGGHVTLGRDAVNGRYGWDNEFGHHEADVPAFKMSRFLVSNAEFLEFVEAGGYTHAAWWDDDGWQWREYAAATHPTFWVRANDQWTLRLMTREVAMPWSWPVEVNAHEARAFCHWKAEQTEQSVRLPSEDEWHRALAESGWQYGDDANLYLNYGAGSTPVDFFTHGAFGDIVGNVWQWTQTPTHPFDGFDVHPIYDDFTTPTFDGRHDLIKGGSWISTGNEAEPDARYAFRRHFFQHAGFRYVVAEHTPVPPSHYETDHLLSQYGEFHYGASYFNVPNFPKTLAELAVKACDGLTLRHALDLGCASGRATFELARYFDRVTGVDFSARFINQGVRLARAQPLRYALAEEGELTTPREVTLEDLGLQDVVERVDFYQGDACNLKPQLSGYDLILAANLIDRLYNPAQFLKTIHERLHIGGVLMIASPYTWLAEHTPKEQWLGGYMDNGKPVTTLDGLHRYLDEHFEALGEPQQVPFVIRETAHKFQHTVSEVTLWTRSR